MYLCHETGFYFYTMISEKVILQVLAEQREEIKSYKSKKWVNRIEESLFDFDTNMAQVVIGVRRSGKSTLCHKVLLEKGLKYGYINLDDERLCDMKTEDLNTVLSCVYQLYGTDVTYLILDEVQNVDGWYLFVNRLLRTDFHVFITGSNAKLLSGELVTHLTGRYNEIRLFPFSFSEYCSYHGIDMSGITTKADAERKQAFVNYLHDGGFPEIQKLRNKRGYIESLTEAIVRKDIQKRFKIRNIEALRKMLHYLINNACHEVNYDTLSTTLGISDKTVKKYADYLREAFIIQLLPRHSFKVKERLRTQKAYLVDTGLQSYISNALAPENMGWRLENVVYIELLRRCSEHFLDIYYFKPNSKAKEVDFVVCDKGKALELIQVAYDIDSLKTFKRETSSLVKASDTLHCNQLTLIASTPTRDISKDGKAIHIISALEWLKNP